MAWTNTYDAIGATMLQRSCQLLRTPCRTAQNTKANNVAKRSFRRERLVLDGTDRSVGAASCLDYLLRPERLT